MKRSFAFILIMVILLGLCGCGSKGKGNESNHISVELPSNLRNSPSQDIIQKDIENEISAIPNARLTGITTVKSLTEDNQFEVTLQVSAETIYADWKMECDMSYTKYDQGWMLDKINWHEKNFDQYRFPDDASMIDYAASVLATHREYSDAYYTDYMLPMYDPVIEFISEPEIEAIKLCWYARENEKHDYISHLFTSYWVYEPSIDNWLLIEDVQKDNDKYKLTFERIGIVPGNYDFTGEWTQELSSFEKEIGIVNRIIIADFSWEKLEAYIPDLDAYIDIDPVFYFVGEEFGVLKFENSYMQSINFQFAEEWTNVYFCVLEYDIAQATARVYQDLPPLS